jgi:hypothetical protein
MSWHRRLLLRRGDQFWPGSSRIVEVDVRTRGESLRSSFVVAGLTSATRIVRCEEFDAETSVFAKLNARSMSSFLRLRRLRPQDGSSQQPAHRLRPRHCAQSERVARFSGLRALSRRKRGHAQRRQFDSAGSIEPAAKLRRRLIAALIILEPGAALLLAPDRGA